jgi:hypothetical protein
LSIILSHFPVFISNDSSVGANDTNINALFFYKYRQNNIIKTKYGRIKIKVRENRRSNQERTIQKHWQYWAGLLGRYILQLKWNNILNVFVANKLKQKEDKQNTEN